MKLPGLIEFNTNLNHDDIADYKIINLTFSEKDASKIISELGLIKEIKYFKSLFDVVTKDLEINETDNVAIVSPSIKDLIFNLSILCAIQNKNVEYINEVMYYTGPLRTNTHLQDEDFELNLEDYDVSDLED